MEKVMLDENSRSFSRVAHYFRNVDLSSDSSPDFIPEGFWSGCCVEAPYWPARVLLREAIRSHHIWATFGIRSGRETINGTQPAVCFSGFNVADLIAVRDGLSAADEHATQYAITFPTRSAELAGAEQVVRGGNLRAFIDRKSIV